MMQLSVIDFGGVPDGKTLNTDAFAKAIAAIEEANGGTIIVPSGDYVTGPIELVSQLKLYLEPGARIRFTDDFEAYPATRTRWSGYECYGFHPLLFGENLEDVTICGEGTIDGQGQAWWDIANGIKQDQWFENGRTKEIREKNDEYVGALKTNVLEWETQFLRPPLLQLLNCKRVTIEGVTLERSPFWNTHLVYCDHVSVRGVTIKNPADTPNGDGLDIDSCSNVRITDCHFDVGDDCLCLKSGINEDGRRVNRPTENVVVTNCTMASGHGGIVFGSESSGGIKNVTVTNCVFIGTDRGIRLKTNRARGSYIKQLLISNIYMEDVFCPIAINSFYRYGVDENNPDMNAPHAIEVSEKTPIIKDISISHIMVRNARAAAAFIYGLPEMPIRNLHLSNIDVEMTTDPNEEGGEPDMVKETVLKAGDGMFIRYVDGLSLNQVRVETRQGSALTISDSQDIEVLQFKMKHLHSNIPVISAANCKDFSINSREYQRDPFRYLQTDDKTKVEI
ncbi:hypothetical protein CR203_06725 [Salipaludibacillus neizhouensis]|uniref:Glycoside hydrolase n=2 Tax=Salipaludibacillus neizhouensis TaxID=885475 RepID=A0A3A9KK57_9BACI|nr:hypothetical protein CR203_06725 [Salipaludibacillus neizhouensis]